MGVLSAISAGKGTDRLSLPFTLPRRRCLFGGVEYFSVRTKLFDEVVKLVASVLDFDDDLEGAPDDDLRAQRLIVQLSKTPRLAQLHQHP